MIEFKKPGVTPESPASATVTLMRDGNQIVALLGPDLQAGIGGFGDTSIEALRDLADQMEFEKHPLPGNRFSGRASGCAIIVVHREEGRGFTMAWPPRLEDA